MKKGLHIISLFLVVILSFTLCKKKEESALPASTNTTTTAPTYTTTGTGTSSTTSTGTSSTTVTGTNTPGNTATQNSALTVGGPGWSYNSCATAPDVLTGFNGPTQVQILFGGGSIIQGAYAFTSGIPTSGQARMTITDAPGQPSGITWYSKNGTISVTTGTAGTTATFSNIGCLQQSYLFPFVTASVSLTCI